MLHTPTRRPRPVRQIRPLGLILLAGAVALVTQLAGCNTVMGVGKDLHDSAQTVKFWMDDTNTDDHEQLVNQYDAQDNYRHRY